MSNPAAKKKTAGSAARASESASESASEVEDKVSASFAKTEQTDDLLVPSAGPQKPVAKPAEDARVFLSYQSGYRQIVERMRERFEREGISTWMDK